MKQGYLSQYFDGVAVKVLSAVESDILVSHQHEFNGVKELRSILGEPEGKTKYDTCFLYLTDDDNEPVMEDGILTWYDAREKARTERSVMRYEYRLYFPDNQVIQCIQPGDILLIAKKPDNTLLAIIAESGTTIASQIVWLFGITNIDHPGFVVRNELDTDHDRIEFTSRIILESIGVTIETSEEAFLDGMISRFGSGFPPTAIFSDYARKTLSDIHPADDPDGILLAFMEREEVLFRTMEKHIIAERLARGFDNDVDSFISFSLSVQNRRKSRAGLAFENHLEYIFRALDIRYSRTPATENRAKPDFLFPGKTEYHDPSFPAESLTMLGVKSSCKDRWRQVLAEADRIENKHLLTLEAAISPNQTDEMQAKMLQLVIPRKIQASYTTDQQKWLMDVDSFTKLVLKKQRATRSFLL